MLLVLLLEMVLFSLSLSSRICVMGTMWTNGKILRTYSLTGQVRKNNVTTDVQILQKLHHYFDVQNTKTNKVTEMDRISSLSY